MEKDSAVIYRFPMSGKLASATDEAGATPETSALAPQGATREPPLAFLRVGKTVLSEDELASPATRRFMIAEIERLEGVCAELSKTEQGYHDLRVKYAALEEARKSSKLIDVVSAVCLAAGSAGLGAAPGYLSVHGAESIGWSFIIGSVLLVVVAVGIIAVQVFRK